MPEFIEMVMNILLSIFSNAGVELSRQILGSNRHEQKLNSEM